MITVRKINRFSKVYGVWTALYNENKELSYYQSPEYMNVLCNNIIPYIFILRMKPSFYVCYSDEKPIMIIPLYQRWGSRDAVLLGYKMGLGYLDCIYPGTIKQDTISECISTTKKEFNISTIEYEHVQKETRLGEWILSNGGKVNEVECTKILLPANYDDYITALSKHMKQNLRTAYNRLRTDGGSYTFESNKYSDLSKDKREENIKMYIGRQIGRYEKSGLYQYFVKYIDIGTKIQTSFGVDVRSFRLIINGKIAAFFDGICNGSEVIIPRLAIDDSFARYSPGVMLINESIKVLIDEGFASIDLTHGAEQYKKAMGGINFQTVSGII